MQELAKINDGLAWEVKEGPNTSLSNKTNVWQVGMLIACCMRLSTYLPGLRISIPVSSKRSTNMIQKRIGAVSVVRNGRPPRLNNYGSEARRVDASSDVKSYPMRILITAYR
jgi:hypothetical protein